MSSQQIRERVHPPLKAFGDYNTKFSNKHDEIDQCSSIRHSKKRGECAVHRTIQKQNHLAPG